MNTIELAWAITSYVSIIAIFLITGICFIYFVRPYLDSTKNAIFVGVVYIAVMLVLYIIPQPLDNFSAYAVGILAAFIVMYMEDRRNIEQKIFLAVTFFSLRWLSIAMADKVNTFLYVKIVMNESVAERPWKQFGVYVGLKILDVGISFLFIVLSIFLLNNAFKCKKANLTKKELLMLVMPSLSGMIGYAIIQFYQSIYEHDIGKSLISAYGIYVYLSFFHYLIQIISILVMVVLFQNLKVMQEETASEKLIQSQIEDMKEHISEVEKLYQDIRLLRHDVGNHIQIIENLIDSGGKEEAKEYTSRLRQEWQGINFEIKSCNPVIDVILWEKKKEAEERNIRFECDFHYPECENVNAFDISVILNNALNNSLESVNGVSPYIKILSYRKNSIFMIVISNSFEGNIVIDDDTKLPITTKKAIGHGLGLINIRKMAQRYFGDIVFEQEGDCVELSIMLQIN